MWLRNHRRNFVFTVSLVFLAGCASGAGGNSLSGFWERTRQTVSSAYETTKNTVSSAFRKMSVSSDEKVTVKTTSSDDRASSQDPASSEDSARGAFASRPSAGFEEDIKSGRLKPITEPQVRGSGDKKFRVIPRKKSAGELGSQVAELDRQIAGERDSRRKESLLKKRRRLARARAIALKEENLARAVDKERAKLRKMEQELENMKKFGR